MHNSIRERRRTCRTRTAPVDGYAMCFRYHRRWHLGGLVDAVTPLVYAIAGDPSVQHLRGFKNCLLRRERDWSAEIATALPLGRTPSIGEIGS
jgi:hypothetical protein